MLLESATNCHKLQRAQSEVTSNVLPPVSCQCSNIFMPCSSGAKGRTAFAYVKSRQHKVFRLKSSQDVVNRELGAPYVVHHLLDTGHIVLTPVAGGSCGANPTAPRMCEKTVAALRRIWSLHLSSTEAQHLTPHLVNGVPWKTCGPQCSTSHAHFKGLRCHDR